MRVVTLIENTACRDDLHPEHGLSLHLETGTHKVLFDMGKTSGFADNAEKLGIDLAGVDFAVLSHGHYDHGGLRRFLELNETAPVYVHPQAFEEFFNHRDRAFLESAAEKMLAGGGMYYTGHCIGAVQYDVLKTRMGERIQAIRTGSEFVI